MDAESYLLAELNRRIEDALAAIQRQDNALIEKDAEIERLKAQVKELSEAYQKAIGPIRPADKDAEIEWLKRRNAQLEKLNLMTDEEVLIDLKAEIERLLTKSEKDKNTLLVSLEASTKEIERMTEQAIKFRDMCLEKDQLITELADALDKAATTGSFELLHERNHLLQRAREVIK